jgi:hypothetical protein
MFRDSRTTSTCCAQARSLNRAESRPFRRRISLAACTRDSFRALVPAPSRAGTDLYPFPPHVLASGSPTTENPSDDLVQWLASAGYRHLATVSWPHVFNSSMQGWARTTQAALERELNNLLGRSSVFLDETHIQIGDDWQSRLSGDLCRSVAMVAVCAPPYFSAQHPWCGVEWAAMRRLSERRLGGEPDGLILPLLFRGFHPTGAAPAALAATQFHDVSNLVITPTFSKTRRWTLAVRQVAERIVEVAEALRARGAAADCTDFELPVDSVFADYCPPSPVAPLRVRATRPVLGEGTDE